MHRKVRESEDAMSAQSEEKVSVIIPTYNREATVGNSIQSVLNQTWQNFEIIVVDDGSTDNTCHVVEAFADDRIRYVCLEQNEGASRARNEGIRLAESEFIAFLDSDDEWLPAKLEKQMRVMLQAPETVGLVYCRMKGTEENGATLICPELERPIEELQGNMLFSLLEKNAIGTPAMLVRKQCLEQTGGFDEGLRSLEDWELVLRIAGKWEISFVDEILVEVHYSKGGVSRNSKGHVEARCYMIAKYWELMAQRNILNDKVAEVLLFAKFIGYYDEAKQLLAAALHL